MLFPPLIPLLRSLAFDGIFYVGTLVMGVLWMPFLWLPRQATVAFARLWAQMVLGAADKVLGLRYTVEGLEHLPPRPFIVASKHQSAWETIAFLALFDDPVFVLKRSLFYIPVVGWVSARMGMIGVRGGGSFKMRQFTQEARQIVACKRSLVVFPEGTRTSPDNPSPPLYKKGLWHLYKTLNVPVVPVALNAGLFWPRRTWLKKPGHIRVLLSPPLVSRDYDGGQFHTWLQQNIEKLSAPKPSSCLGPLP